MDRFGPNSGTAIEYPSASERKRIWSKVSKSTKPDDCWRWNGAEYNGYGRVSFRLKNIPAHRVVMAIINRGLGCGVLVAHKCNNPICCNPRHLKLSNQSDNMQDCIKSGRKVFNPQSGGKHWTRRIGVMRKKSGRFVGK